MLAYDVIPRRLDHVTKYLWIRQSCGTSPFTRAITRLFHSLLLGFWSSRIETVTAMPEWLFEIENSPHNASYTSDSSPMSQQFYWLRESDTCTVHCGASFWSQKAIQVLQSQCEKTKRRARDCERVYCFCIYNGVIRRKVLSALCTFYLKSSKIILVLLVTH